MPPAAGKVKPEAKGGEVKAGEDIDLLEGQLDPDQEEGETEEDPHDAPADLSAFIEDKAKEKGRCYYLCYVITKNVFSTFGTVFVVCAYAAFGGWLFTWLEADTDLPGNLLLSTIDVKSRVDEIWMLTNELKNETTNDIEKDVWTNGTFKFLRNFRVAVFNVTRNTHWNGFSTHICNKAMNKANICNDPNRIYQKTEWNFLGSVFFAVQLITTIGYGNITPKSETGRIVAMAYATLGIPITLLCLAMVGRMFAQLYRYLFQQLLHTGSKSLRKCCRKKKKRPSVVDKNTQNTGKRSKTEVLSEFEVAQAANANNSSGQNGLAGPERKADKDAFAEEDADKGPDYRQEDDYEDEAPLRVPLTITTLTIIFYVYIGTLIFKEFKKDEGWTNIIASYFCFITLSTIGLGDYSMDSRHPDQIPVAGIYLLVGLALLSMCFDLLAVEMEGKFVDISIILGIASHDAADGDSSSEEEEEEEEEKEEEDDDDHLKNPAEEFDTRKTSGEPERV